MADGTRVEILYFTDPCCSWCWASEPEIKRLLETYGNQVAITYKMGGLVESMDSFYDPVNDISRPDQVAPHWAEVSRVSGMPIDERIWLSDPPLSTWPANIAYKAAEFQGSGAAGRYLRRLREAVLTEQRNLERKKVLLALAREVGLDEEEFAKALDGGAAEEAFKADLTEARAKGIRGFPTLVFRTGTGREVRIYGHVSFKIYDQVIQDLAGPLPRRDPPEPLQFVEKYGRVTTREVEEVCGLSRAEAVTKLEGFVSQGTIRKVAVANGEFWVKLPTADESLEKLPPFRFRRC